MSDPEENNYCFFGKPLEPYDEDAFPKKKPISVEEQIATDAQGRRRFHGAFTGGFSAGFYNTVGSLEGWLPSDYKSTRQDKAEHVPQKPEDFMDDEDISEFGIAPQTVRATKDYCTSKKRKKTIFTDGPIPGEPVLHSLLTSGNETIGYLLLKNMSLEDKIQQRLEIESEQTPKIYGCEMPKNNNMDIIEETLKSYEIPEIYNKCLKHPKNNSFGLGYVGLNHENVKVFNSSKLVINEKNKKKLSIYGQAFGVGAFEEDDDDVYVKEDMSKYDFELTNEKIKKKLASNNNVTILDDFVCAKDTIILEDSFLPPALPKSFIGKHNLRKSRFEPLIIETEEINRKYVNPEIRAKYLGEESHQNYTYSKCINKIRSTKEEKNEPAIIEVEKNNSEIASAYSKLILDRFVCASQAEDTHNILEEVKRSEILHGNQEMRDAVKLKMFGPLTRIIINWQPTSSLCKRFNVVEPNVVENKLLKNRKRTKNLIFEYQTDKEKDIFKAGLSLQKTENNANNESVIESSIQILTNVSNEADHNTDLSIQISKSHMKADDTCESTLKDITEKLNISERVNLFKDVFLSSSESEEEEEGKPTESSINYIEEMKNNILSDNFVFKIKPAKEGILSNMDFSILKHTENIIHTHEKMKSDNETSDTYGPKLPEKIDNSSISHTLIQSNDDSEWVEKNEKLKHKHKKKHKKDSHKKKHKYKKNKL